MSSKEHLSINATTEASIDLLEVVEQLDKVDRRKLTLHQLAELITNEGLSTLEIKAIREVVLILNEHTELRFTSYNPGLSSETARLIGLKP